MVVGWETSPIIVNSFRAELRGGNAKASPKMPIHSGFTTRDFRRQQHYKIQYLCERLLRNRTRLTVSSRQPFRVSTESATQHSVTLGKLDRRLELCTSHPTVVGGRYQTRLVFRFRSARLVRRLTFVSRAGKAEPESEATDGLGIGTTLP